MTVKKGFNRVSTVRRKGSFDGEKKVVSTLKKGCFDGKNKDVSTVFKGCFDGEKKVVSTVKKVISTNKSYLINKGTNFYKNNAKWFLATSTIIVIQLGTTRSSNEFLNNHNNGQSVPLNSDLTEPALKQL